MIRVLNFGVGTQSSYLLAKMDRGEIEPAKIAIFADTGNEPKAVYEHLAFMQSVIKNIPIVVLDGVDIVADALRSQVRGKVVDGKRWASMPFYILKIWQPEEAEAYREIYLNKPLDEDDPWALFGFSMTDGTAVHLFNYNALKAGKSIRMDGMINRQCTYEYKIKRIDRYINREVLGWPKGFRAPPEPVIERVMGISFDERQRVTISKDRWAVNDYPLVEMRMRRHTVIAEAEAMFPGRKFPRSACKVCPFHHNDEWRDMKQNRPEEWAEVVAFDKAIRNCGGMRGQCFLHGDRVPLDEVDLSRDVNFLTDGMVQECTGYCGV